MAREVTLKDSNGILYPQVGPGQITNDNLASTVGAGEVAYTYTQAADSNSDVELVFPVDLSKYSKIVVTISYGIGSGITAGWNACHFRYTQSDNCSTVRYGVFLNGSSTVQSNYNTGRTDGESIIIYTAASSQVLFDFVVTKQTAACAAWGGQCACGTFAGWFNGRAWSSSALPAYIKYTMIHPRAGGTVTVIGYK